MAFAKADSVTARFAIHIGVTPAKLEQADRSELVRLSKTHAFSIR